EDVHHAPGVVGGVSMQLAPDRGTHNTARAVGAHDVPGPYRSGGTASGWTQRDGDGVITSVRDLDTDGFEPIVGLEPGRRFLHVLQKILLQARLIDNDVRHLGKLSGRVVDAACAPDA